MNCPEFTRASMPMSRHQPEWGMPDLPPGRAFGDAVIHIPDMNAFERIVLSSRCNRPPEVGHAPFMLNHAETVQ